jgi:hypothetical protein
MKRRERQIVKADFSRNEMVVVERSEFDAAPIARSGWR